MTDIKIKLNTLRSGILADRDNTNMDPHLLKLLDIVGEIGGSLGINRVQLFYDEPNNRIIDVDSNVLSYSQIVELVDDTHNFVTLQDSDSSYLLPHYGDGAAVIFTGLDIYSYGDWSHRIGINSDNEVKREFFELVRRETTGSLDDLETDHKSDLVSAINELFEILETAELVVSMDQSTADRKVIYDLVVAHPQIAKEIVFYNSADQLYYRVNGYNMVNGILTLHVIMKDGALMDRQVQIGSNGSIAII